MSVILHKESMVQRSVENCHVHCKAILDLVGEEAFSVEVKHG